MRPCQLTEITPPKKFKIQFFRFLNLFYGNENSLTSFRAIIGTIANRMHPWWDEGANSVKLRNEKSEGIFQDKKMTVRNNNL